ncbi:hypothetical protein BJX64DRAFT_290685 [Aspergillus heterothallicus]
MSGIDPEIISGYSRTAYLDRCMYKPATVNLLKIDFYAKQSIVDLASLDDAGLSESLKSVQKKHAHGHLLRAFELKLSIQATNISHRATGGFRLIFGPTNEPFNHSKVKSLDFPFLEGEYAFARTTIVPFSKETFKRILHVFRLPAATAWNLLTQSSHFQEYALGDRSLKGYTMRRSTRGVLPMDIALSITYDQEKAMTYALLLGCTQSQQAFLHKQLISLPKLARHPLLLPVLFAEYQHTFLNERDLYLWNRLLAVETTSGRTGAPQIQPIDIAREHPGNAPRFSIAQRSERKDVTNQVLGIIQVATNQQTYAEALVSVVDCVQDSMDALCTHRVIGTPNAVHGHLQEIAQILSASVQFTKRKSEALLSDFRFIEKRAQAQMNAVYNHTTQQIAEASKRDTTAMKAIALLTMFFLPPTFAATFIAMPVFDFSAPAGGIIARQSFWVYWAITAPLTLLVLGMYFAYLWYTERRLRAEDRSGDGGGGRAPGGPSAPLSPSGMKGGEQKGLFNNAFVV